MGHTPLLTRAEAPQYGIPGEFLSQFDVRPIQISASTGGALGAAVMRWRPLGETTWSDTITSSSRAPWTWVPAGAFASLVFAAGTYTTTATYTIDEDGTVTRSGAGPDTITATRWDAFEKAAASVTDQATDKMQPRFTLPLTSWGDGVKQAAADWIKYVLKSAVGMAAGPSASGDENIRLRAEDAQLYFARLGRGDLKSSDIVDSSVGNVGGGLMVRATGATLGNGDTLRGWGSETI